MPRRWWLRMTSAPFSVTFAPELTPPQWVVERAGLRVVPSCFRTDNGLPWDDTDAQGERRAREVCAVLNRVYGAEVARGVTP